ncbi:uncharacterized protein LTHEOB_1888 [Lasiodiplodia theobromae]|uniref:uncharacterized protein n=1 Tax=Lasiodiplodia theobromae TaxID=45133 RepID=UPI0015C39877|nr:uncharacterized protein LTHEOB_1888 [Lasiodiplodia theobromae]KAF4536127.1 hypothetical protein LTHEOB_1888 [Lasiodiplodia theobromae]
MHLTVAALFPLLSAAVPGEEYILSPASRIIEPVSIWQTSGKVTGAVPGQSYRAADVYSLSGPNASITLDFGRETAGIPHLHFRRSACKGDVCQTYGLPSLECNSSCQGLGVSYSESAAFIGPESDWSTYFTVPDGAVYIPMRPGNFSMPRKWGRGGFRYLAFSLGPKADGSTSVEFQFQHVYFTPQPNIKDDSKLGEYTGYFWSDDVLLNRIWHAGVYTLQLCQIRADSLVNHNYTVTGGGWAEDAVVRGVDPKDVVMGEGAKRDRNPWPADMSVSLRSALVSQNYDNLRALKNLLIAVMVLQDPVSGYFPYAGSPFGDFFAEYGDLAGFEAWSSDTYNLWTIINFIDYVLITDDFPFAHQRWAQVVRALEATYQYIDPATGLFNGTKPSDWGRDGVGGTNAALNALYHHALTRAAHFSTLLSNSTNTTAAPRRWLATAARVKAAFNTHLWDAAASLYRDNTTTTSLHPQDGNAFAILFDLVDPDPDATAIPTTNDTNNNNNPTIPAIAAALSSRLTPYGAPAPELPGAVSPFVSSHELLAQFKAAAEQPRGGGAGGAGPAMRLLRTQWGYMLRAFSNATLVEGYSSVDGSLAYGFYGDAPRFISHAHTFATGPVYALMAEVVGVRAVRGVDVEGEEEGEWVVWPKVVGSGVGEVKGGFRTVRGWWGVEWWVVEEGAEEGAEAEQGGVVWEARIETPEGLVGTVYVPLFGGDARDEKVFLDGVEVGDGEVMGAFVRIGNVTGGCHQLRVES